MESYYLISYLYETGNGLKIYRTRPIAMEPFRWYCDEKEKLNKIFKNGENLTLLYSCKITKKDYLHWDEIS